MKKQFSLSGFPDFNAIQVNRREYVLSLMKEKFSLFGFSQISTALMEKRDNLVGSYGDDGDKLIFQVLRSGDYLSRIQTDVKGLTSHELSSIISDKSMRYDLTLPFARFVSENQSFINLPFKRYEIGPVFRADRPQKGRLRQFIQCDADIIGTKSLWLEIDLINLIYAIFDALGLKNMVIRISNRKLLEGIFESFSNALDFSRFCTIIDKLDKLDFKKIQQLLLDCGLSQNEILLLENLFVFKGSFMQKKSHILSCFAINENLKIGLEELQFIFDNLPPDQNIDLDLSLARGLDYYTGSVFEALSLNSNNGGSVLGGGRYDQLTEKFNTKHLSGVGISFGLERLCLLLDELDLFPKDWNNGLDVLFINFGLKEAQIAQAYIYKLRKLGISSELYPDDIKMNKQLNYANKRGVKFVIMIGEDEIKTNKLSVKNMFNGNQKLLTLEEFINLL